MIPKAVVFDMDGVIRIGNSPVPGTNSTLAFLSERKIPFMLVTNECRYTPEEIKEDLEDMGLTLPANLTIFTAALAVAKYLENKIARFPNNSWIFGIIGENGLYEAITNLSHNKNVTISNLPPPESKLTPSDQLFLICGAVDKIKISTLEKARLWVKAGCKVLLTCDDFSDPSSKGDFTLGMPKQIIHMISYNTPTLPYSTGKPHPLHAKKILETFPKTQPSEILFVGDSMNSDIRLAEESGFRSCLVLSGNTSIEALTTWVIEPDFILDSIKDIPTLFNGDSDSFLKESSSSSTSSLKS